jgi:hypothetical protein
MIASIFFSAMASKRPAWVFRKHAGFPQRGNPARMQASLAFPMRRGTMPAQPFSRFSPTPRLVAVDEKKGTGYFFYMNCARVETVLFLPEKVTCPLFTIDALEMIERIFYLNK